MAATKHPEFAILTGELYSAFKEDIDALRSSCSGERLRDGFRELVVSAYCKCYDFVQYMCALPDLEHAFFQLPMLRGICEDLISISYLLELPAAKTNYVVVSKRFEELKKATAAQYEFLEKYNRGQLVLPKQNQTDFADVLEEYRAAGFSFETCRLPNVAHMAKATGQEDLYRFIYHATSKMVHFDVFTLSAMGWGELSPDGETLKAVFSYKHYFRHYYSFALFYSSYLFLLQTHRFRSYLDLPEDMLELLNVLEEKYTGIDWPELVTFEQLNLQRPSELSRTIYRFCRTKLDPDS